MENWNKHIRFFCISYLFMIIYMIVVIKNSRDMYESYGSLFVGTLFFIVMLFIFSTSFITRTKILNWIYLILFFLGSVYALFQEKTSSYTYYYFDYKISFNTATFFRFFNILSIFLSLIFSFFIFSYLKKRKKEISFWALAFNIEVSMMFCIWFCFEKVNQNIWYYLPFIVVLMSVLIVYIWLMWKEKKIKKRQWEKKEPSKFMPKI